MNRQRVLLIEDDAIVQQVHKAMLVKLGCDVDVADNGTTALKMAKENLPYRVIFVDIGLPDMSGFDVIQELRSRQQETLLECNIVVITGYCGTTEKQACLDVGVTDVLNKPVLINTMRVLLEKYAF